MILDGIVLILNIQTYDEWKTDLDETWRWVYIQWTTDFSWSQPKVYLQPVALSHQLRPTQIASLSRDVWHVVSLIMMHGIFQVVFLAILVLPESLATSQQAGLSTIDNEFEKVCMSLIKHMF